VDGIHPFDIGQMLDARGIAVRTGHHCTQPLMDRYGIEGTVRASFAVYNTTGEIDQLVEGLERIINFVK
jgi:cysteine desulfurase/selenocysteine lyase